MAAACGVFENVTRRYRKPDWHIDEVSIPGHAVPVEPEVVRSRLFCDLLHFKRGEVAGRHDPPGPHAPQVLIVEPLSAHYATLPRGPLRAMLPAPAGQCPSRPLTPPS